MRTVSIFRSMFLLSFVAVMVACGGLGSKNSGNGNSGSNNPAMFNNPSAVAVDSSGYVYVADSGNNTIRMISPTPNWPVRTIAGTAGSSDGPGIDVFASLARDGVVRLAAEKGRVLSDF